MKRSFFAVAVIAAGFVNFAFTLAAPVSADQTSTFFKIERSLALVVAKQGRKSDAGTAFCVGDHAGTAYFLTNKHVVGSDTHPRVVVRSDPTSVLYGQIVRISTVDAVILAVKNASCSPVTFSADCRMLELK